MDQRPSWERGPPARMRASRPHSASRHILTLVALGGALLAGCWSPPESAGILIGTTPPGASCILSRLGQPIATVAPTPAIALVEPSAGEITILCRRQGFADAVVNLPAQELGVSFSAIVYGRPHSDYQRRVDIVLEPRPPGLAPR
jgi:hypothetical protein